MALNIDAARGRVKRTHHQGGILGTFAFARAVDVFAQGDIAHPVHAVFVLPRRPNHIVQVLGSVIGRLWRELSQERR